MLTSETGKEVVTDWAGGFLKTLSGASAAQGTDFDIWHATCGGREKCQSPCAKIETGTGTECVYAMDGRNDCGEDCSEPKCVTSGKVCVRVLSY